MRELSVFVDESGNLGDDAKYYLLALALHDQSKNVFSISGVTRALWLSAGCATAVSKYDKKASVPALGRGFFFAVLLPFTCDFAICSPSFKTTKYGAVSGFKKLKQNSMGILRSPNGISLGG